MKEQTRTEPKIVAAAERQMQAWSLTQEIADKLIRLDQAEQVAGRLGDYITISREAGAGGGQIAELVGRTLGWEVLDKSLLDHVASRYHLSRKMLELVDETQAGWVYDIFGTGVDRKIIPHEKYFVCLSRVVQTAARRGNVVLVGRGAQFLLPREQGLAVRIVASQRYRTEQLMQRHGLDAAKARQLMDELDRGRHEFAERFFRRDITDPHLYDLVINVERFGPTTAAEQIVEAYPA